ncbi:chromosome partitioning protein [Pseudonocardia sp. 73-21]|uniref:chromosome partitioning protein n=1 Tax=Pseudonocardia sp. 73-21 TaxID=1895809 RepID=UPI0009671F77|nr:chromosome partitioning protein [Pseudonocardia sp. 73-21]OJY48113.1 MAG: hypothetical protein BGP03_13665 [Pseudonocardia sp. 73-21]
MMIAVVSVKGSPGVTTLCLALAACWPDPGAPIVVEADPAGGDVAMRFGLAPSPGLLSLAAAARGRAGTRGEGVARPAEGAELVWRHAQPLPGNVPVVAAPPDAGRARGALAVLATLDGAGGLGPGPLRAAAAHPGAVQLVDCGRVDEGSPVMPLLRSADVMVVLTGAGADDLAHLARRIPEIGAWSRDPVLLLTGGGHSIAAVARELGVTPLARVPHDPRGAAVLTGHHSVLRWHRSGPGRSVLGQSAREIADALAARAAIAATPGDARPNPASRRAGATSNDSLGQSTTAGRAS